MSVWSAEWYDEIDSTNEEARRRVSAGSFQNSWIAARQQTAGRGRLGRHWQSPRGNLYATALFRLEGGIPAATKIPFVSALAVADVFEAYAPDAPVLLKWPNDVRREGAKVSGILVEAGILDRSCWIACGIGINVAAAPEGTGQAATSLADMRGDNILTAELVLEDLRIQFSSRFEQLRAGFESVRIDWLQRAEGLGNNVKVQVGNEAITGVFEDLGPNGQLLLRLPNGSQRSITAGDVELIKERSV